MKEAGKLNCSVMINKKNESDFWMKKRLIRTYPALAGCFHVAKKWPFEGRRILLSHKAQPLTCTVKHRHKRQYCPVSLNFIYGNPTIMMDVFRHHVNRLKSGRKTETSTIFHREFDVYDQKTEPGIKSIELYLPLLT